MNPSPQGVAACSTSPLACVAAGPPVPPTFQLDTALQLQADFYAPGGVTHADPTTVTLIVQDPTGTNTTYAVTSGQIVKVSTGVYTFPLTPSASGQWIYKWQGTGALVVTSDDIYFTVAPSALISG